MVIKLMLREFNEIGPFIFGLGFELNPGEIHRRRYLVLLGWLVVRQGYLWMVERGLNLKV